MILYGLMEGCIDGKKGFPLNWKKYPVPAGVPHSARAISTCIFINLERWKSKDVTSAAVDFTAV